MFHENFKTIGASQYVFSKPSRLKSTKTNESEGKMQAWAVLQFQTMNYSYAVFNQRGTAL